MVEQLLLAGRRDLDAGGSQCLGQCLEAGPPAPVAYRSLLRQVADLSLAQFWSLRRRHYLPALALPRRDPPRYLIPLLKVSQAELRSALTRLAPGTPIVMIWT